MHGTREKQEHERNGNRSGRDGNEGVSDTVTERKDMSCGTTAGTEWTEKGRNKTKAE